MGIPAKKPSKQTLNTSVVCSSGRTCPNCGCTVDGLTLRCPRCLQPMPGWSCAGCLVRSTCIKAK